jgi:hypothetical protein
MARGRATKHRRTPAAGRSVFWRRYASRRRRRARLRATLPPRRRLAAKAAARRPGVAAHSRTKPACSCRAPRRKSRSSSPRSRSRSVRPSVARAPDPSRTAQTVSRRRPFARLRLSTFRPPLVDMRSRKPWVFFRRRRFGWYVRFTRSSSGQGCNLVAGTGKSNHPTDACFIKSRAALLQSVSLRPREGLTRPRDRVLWLAARFPGRMDSTRRAPSAARSAPWSSRPLGAVRPR